MSQLALIVPLSGGRPDNTLPTPPPSGGSGGEIDNALPMPPVTPDNTLPETPEASAPPQIALPIVLPPTVSPTPPARARYFEVKYSVKWGWVLVPVKDEVAAPKR